MTEARLYRPSNGTEGECFYAQWCAKCEHDRASWEGGEPGDGCRILADSYAYALGHPDYPEEWRFNDAGRPICTAFKWAGEEVGWPIDPHAVVRPLL